MVEQIQIEEFRQFLQELAGELGLDTLTSSASGLASLEIDDEYIVNLQLIPAEGKIMIFLPFLDVSDFAAAPLRELLTANLFGEETGGGWFGLEEESGTLVYHYLVNFNPAEPPNSDEFVRILEQILELVEIWRVHLSEEQPAEPPPPPKSFSVQDILSDIRFTDIRA